MAGDKATYIWWHQQRSPIAGIFIIRIFRKKSDFQINYFQVQKVNSLNARIFSKLRDRDRNRALHLFVQLTSAPSANEKNSAILNEKNSAVLDEKINTAPEKK